MPIAAYDRVRESTTTTGTGTITLAGVAAGPYQSFAVVGNGNQCVYCIADQSGVGNDWEVGIGTYSTTGPSLARTTVTGSSNSGNLVNFPAGVKDVFVVYSAARSVDLGDVGTAPNQIPLNQYLGKLAFMDVLDTVSNNPYYDTAISDVEPTLNLDFVNSKTLDSRITFTRATTATYYDGKSSAVAEQNLLLWSQLIGGTSWLTTSAVVVTNNTTAPDSTNTGSNITTVLATLVHNVFSNTGYYETLGTTYTFSVYAKVNTNNFIQLAIASGGSGMYANFNISTGVITAGSYVSASITSVGSSWYRCSITYTGSANALVSPSIGIASTGTDTRFQSWTAAGTESIYAWGAQLEQRSSATAYNATTTQALTNYIPTLQTAPINVARLDYNPVTGTPNGLLIEEARTNLCLYSSDISNSWWNKASASVSINATADIAPDGTQTANQLIESTNNSPHRVLTTAFTKAASAIAYSWTFYAKANQRGYCWSSLQSSLGNGIIVYFSLNTGAVTSAPAAIGTAFTSVTTTSTLVGNGWYRFVLTATSDTDTALYGYIGLSVDGTSQSYTGNGYSSIYAWGAQLEAGSFPTSYIPTVASQVTRSADSAVMTGTNFSSWYSVGQGTFYAEASMFGVNAFAFGMIAEGASASDYKDISLGFSNLVPEFANRLASSNNNIDCTAITLGNPVKVSGSYSPTTTSLAFNGALGTSITTIPFRGGADRIFIGSRQGTALFLNGYIRKLQYYPIALSSAELQEMTS